MRNKNAAEIVKGNWDELKGSIKKQWGKLSDDDLSHVDGSYDELIGVIKKTYGQAEDKIAEKMQSILEDFDLKDAKNNIQDKAGKIFENAKKAVTDIDTDIIEYVKKNPMKSLLITAVAGALLSKILCSNHK